MSDHEPMDPEMVDPDDIDIVVDEVEPGPESEDEQGHNFEKSPLSSKKFIAYLIAEAGWKAILAAMLFVYGRDLSVLAWGLMMGIIIVSGFVQTGTILGQASLDKFVRIAKINASLGVATSLRGKDGPEESQ